MLRSKACFVYEQKLFMPIRQIMLILSTVIQNTKDESVLELPLLKEFSLCSLIKLFHEMPVAL